jgi:NDP-sugar pyrophosphorylase family protein
MNDDKVNSARDKIGPGNKIGPGDKVGPGCRIEVDWKKGRAFRAQVRVLGRFPTNDGMSSTIGPGMAIPRSLYRRPNSGSAEIDPGNN